MRHSAELQAALDEARFHSRRPAAAARSEPAEPPAYEAAWGAPVPTIVGLVVDRGRRALGAERTATEDDAPVDNQAMVQLRDRSRAWRWSRRWLCTGDWYVQRRLRESHQGSIQAEPCAKVTFWTDWKAQKPRPVDVPALTMPRTSESKSSTPTMGRRKLPSPPR